MANAPKAAREKQPEHPDRRNAQGDHEGSPHTPEEFDTVNPAKLPDNDPPALPYRASSRRQSTG